MAPSRRARGSAARESPWAPRGVGGRLQAPPRPAPPPAALRQASGWAPRPPPRVRLRGPARAARSARSARSAPTARRPRSAGGPLPGAGASRAASVQAAEPGAAVRARPLSLGGAPAVRPPARRPPACSSAAPGAGRALRAVPTARRPEPA